MALIDAFFNLMDETGASDLFLWSSRPGEFHPEALTEPCVSLSTHTALACHEPTTSRW